MAEELDTVDMIFQAASNVVNTSGLILIKDFLKKWRYALTPDELVMQNHDHIPLEKISNADNQIPDELLEELFILTSSADSLYLPEMKPLNEVKLEDVPEEANLKTIKYTRQHKELIKKKVIPEGYAQREFELDPRTDDSLGHKYAKIKAERGQFQTTQEDGTEVQAADQEIDYPEAIVEVNYQKGLTDPKIYTKAKSTHVHMVTKNTLVQLRDEISCNRDYQIPGDFSESPDQVRVSKTAREIFGSSMFFIEDTFYTDTRRLSFKDYSKPIVEWLQKQGDEKQYPVKAMQFSKVADLKIRLGMPYVFIHQGNCEHIIQFTDIRLVHADDCQILAAYPLQITSHYARLHMCSACQIRTVRWMVERSIVSPADPDHYCDICFKMLHYNKKGEKICDFKAYRYTDNVYSTYRR